MADYQIVYSPGIRRSPSGKQIQYSSRSMKINYDDDRVRDVRSRKWEKEDEQSDVTEPEKEKLMNFNVLRKKKVAKSSNLVFW